MKEKCLTPSGGGGGYAKICDDRQETFSPCHFGRRKKGERRRGSSFSHFHVFIFPFRNMCAKSWGGSVPFSRIIFAISSISAGGSSIPNGRGGRAAVNGHFFCLMPPTTGCKGNVCAIHASWHRRRRRRRGHSYQSCRYICAMQKTTVVLRLATRPAERWDSKWPWYIEITNYSTL